MCGADLWGRPSACGGLPGRLSAMLLAGSLARDALYHGRFPAQQSDRETSLSHLCRGRADSRLSMPSLAKTHRGKPAIPRCVLARDGNDRSEEHTSEVQSPCNLVRRLLLEKKKATGVSSRFAPPACGKGARSPPTGRN